MAKGASVPRRVTGVTPRQPATFIDIPLRNDQGKLTGKTSRYAVLADGVYARLTPDQSLPSISTVPPTQETPLYPGGPTRGEMGIPDAARPVLTPTASRPMAPPTERPERPATPMTLGAVGTLFTAGFLTDLQEYNAQFIGRNAFPYYDKMFRTSVPVRASLRACWLPIETAEWEVRPALNPNEPGYEFAVELADMVRENLFGGLETPMRTGGYASQTFKSVVSNALLCLLYGCAAHEILWVVDGSRVRLRALAPRLPITFYRWWVDYDGMTLLGLEQLGYRRNEYVNVIVPAQKLTTFSFGKLGAGFYGISVLRSAFIDWYFLDNLTRINGIAAEHNAVGVPHFEIPEGASPSDVETARKYVTELAAHEAMGVVSPPGFKFEMKGVTGQTHNVVESMRYHAAQIYMNVLAGFLHLAEKVTGSYATGETLSDFFNLAENSVAEMIAEEINLSAVRRLVDYNYELPHTLRIDRMPYPLLKPAKIAVLNPIKLFESIRWLMQDNTDAIQPSDALENKLLELAGLPAKEKARPRFRAIAQTVREAEKGAKDTIPGEPGSAGGIPKQESEISSEQRRLELQEAGGHWVTIEGHPVFIKDAGGEGKATKEAPLTREWKQMGPGLRKGKPEHRVFFRYNGIEKETEQAVLVRVPFKISTGILGTGPLEDSPEDARIWLPKSQIGAVAGRQQMTAPDWLLDKKCEEMWRPNPDPRKEWNAVIVGTYADRITPYHGPSSLRPGMKPGGGRG